MKPLDNTGVLCYNKNKKKGYITMTMTRMMTKRQGFALFCITKKDYRNDNLTYEQASKLIEELGDKNYVKKSVGNKNVEKYNDAARIMEEAIEAGNNALNEAKPTPMVVQQHASVLDDNSPVQKEWVIDGGVCGFAWISFKANTTANRKFLAGLKKAGLAGEKQNGAVWGKSYQGGYSYWVAQGGQSMERKQAFAHAFADVLEKNGLKVYVGSRMD